MKKFLIASATLIMLLLIAYFAYFKYRQIQANRILIPSNTTAVIKINVDELLKTLAISYLKHSKEYDASNEKKLKQNITDLKTGLDIPASIYLYSLNGKDKTTFFTTFKISDSVTFKHFVEKEVSKKLSKKSASYFLSGDSTLSIRFNGEAVALAFAPRKDVTINDLTDVLNSKNGVKVGTSAFAQLTNLSDHVSFQNKESISKMNFADGKIEFGSEFTSTAIEPALKPMHRILSPESTMSLWVNAKYKADLKDGAQKGSAPTLSPSLLKNFYKDYIDVEWLNAIKQVDTVVGYEYNDNFERVEKKILQDNMVPNFAINMDADEVATTNYLEKYGFLNSATGKLQAPLIPLFSFYFKANQGHIQLSTLKTKSLTVKKEASNDFFYFKLDFTKLINQQPFNLLKSKLNIFKIVEIRARAEEKGKIKVNSELTFTNENANALIQILNLAEGGLGSFSNPNLNLKVIPPNLK
ncbi:hypothetical protein DHW03_00590 [Pedobacter yonginense]|uniref:DUF4836 domain-containing protein n=1 Tax=Pedobacter yonginense TaxID=651869 RepID=A0A317ERC1_9SPHI|nr:hypothetical protein [Pedobacter yonginense]PWS28389.1 hypothetical protein DHW03_00590 [Pedobacter yonginense]